MRRERQFKRHVLIAITAVKELLDTNQMNSHTTHNLSRNFGISRHALEEGFRELYGMGIREYKLKQRMALAKHLLKEGRDIKEIAIVLHYSEPRAFSAAFKRFCGATPTEWCMTFRHIA